MGLDIAGLKAVIFDMDGVLFHSSDCHEEAWRDVFQSVGITDFSYTSIAGMRSDEAVRKILAAHGHSVTEMLIEKLVTQKRKRALELLTVRGKVAEGSQTLIRQLNKRYQLVLASSASTPTVELFLKKSGSADAFAFVLDGTAVKRAKPDPEIYRLALEKLSLAPEQAIVIEDAVSGIEAAQRASIAVLALAGTETRETLTEAGAEIVVDRLSEIGAILL